MPSEFKYKLTSKIKGIELFPTANAMAWGCKIDDRARQALSFVLGFNYFFDDAFSGYFHLNEADKYYDPAKAKKELGYAIDKYFKLIDEQNLTEIDALEKLNGHSDLFIDELSCMHGGDCTCFASSCTRCHIESIIGVNTLPIGKHAGYHAQGMSKLSLEQLQEALGKAKEDSAQAVAAKFCIDHRRIFDEYQKSGIIDV